MKVWLVIVILMLGGTQSIATPPSKFEAPLTDSKQENTAKKLFAVIRCPECIAGTIEESPTDAARDLRQLIRDQLKQGRTADDILNDIRQHYSQEIVLKPSFEPGTWGLWLAPLLILGAGGAYLITRRKQT